jgi:hypothetical protein
MNTGVSIVNIDNGTVGGEGVLSSRNIFKWTSRVTPILSMVVSTNMILTNLTASDFLLASWNHYPLLYADSENLEVLPYSTFSREGSPDGTTVGNTVWFSYDTQGSVWMMNKL